MADVILLAMAGSTMHGVGVGAQDDLDLVVVRVEPFEELVTGASRHQSVMVRTQPEGVRSGPGDIDLQCYSFRRFAQLVTAGNPTLLNTLFVPQYFHIHEAFPLTELRDRVDQHRAGRAYLGYMHQQISKWRDRPGSGREELIDQFGFDTKYAYHAIRLGPPGSRVSHHRPHHASDPGAAPIPTRRAAHRWVHGNRRLGVGRRSRG